MTIPKRLRAEGLGHAYALRTVLAGIDFELPAGQVAALVGPSGCGKTTLLHLVAGLLAVREGRLASDFTAPAAVFQQPRLLPWKRALDNISLGLKARGVARRERERRAFELGLRVGLAADDLEKYPHQLSGGMQSRVALARALVMEPDLLLLDEPFSALDIGLKAELYALLAEHLAGREMAVLMITHDLMEAVRLSDQLLVMAPDPGRIVARFDLARPALARDDAFVHQHTAELLQHPTVRASFGLPALGAAGAMPGEATCQAGGGLRWVAFGGAPATRRGLQC
ncbi:ABC transporter ATP-binding protein [Rhodocyclaceae bacterium]|nr:ABC transporter ATP-binding protein [Rhodocyclaceae bacterium]